MTDNQDKTVVRDDVASFVRRRGMVFRITALVIAGLFAMGAVMSFLYYRESYRNLEEAVTGRALSLTKNLAYNAKLSLLSKDRKALQALLDGLATENLFTFAAFRGPDGKTLVTWGQPFDFSFLDATPSADKSPIISDRENPTGLFLFVAPVTASSAGGQATEEELLGLDTPKESAGAEGAIGSIITAVSPLHIKNPARRILRLTLLIGLTTLVALSIILAVLLRISFQPLNSMVRVLSQIALGEGDLTQRIDIARQDEIGLWGRWFNRFVDFIHQVIREVVLTLRSVEDFFKRLGDEETSLLEGANNQITAVLKANEAIGLLDGSINSIVRGVKSLHDEMETSNNSLLGLTQNIGEIRKAGDSLVSRTERVSQSLAVMDQSLGTTANSVAEIRTSAQATAREVQNLDEAITTIKGYTAESADVSLRTKNLAHEGREKMNLFLKGMSEITAAFDEIKSNMDTLKEQLKSIGFMVTTIRDVSRNTKLLSFNASIIAAQAGEHGKGFEVVAAEIKELSELTGRSTKSIEDILKSIHAQSEKVTQTMKVGLEKVSGGMELSTQAKQSLEAIIKGVVDTEELVRRISGSTNEQSASSASITHAMQTLVSAMESISRAISQQHDQGQRISQTTVELGLETSRVQRAIKDQDLNSQKVQEAFTRITTALEAIHKSIQDQLAANREIISLMSAIRSVSESNMTIIKNMDELVARTRPQREKLNQAIVRLKI